MLDYIICYRFISLYKIILLIYKIDIFIHICYPFLLIFSTCISILYQHEMIVKERRFKTHINVSDKYLFNNTLLKQKGLVKKYLGYLMVKH